MLEVVTTNGTHGINYLTSGQRFKNKDTTIRHGFLWLGCDDFRAGKITRGELVEMWWMNNIFPPDETADVNEYLKEQHGEDIFK